jgi:hypothetical protein
MKRTAAALFLASPAIAVAEISDKVQTAPEIFLVGVGFAIVAYVLGTWRWWLSAVAGLLLAAILLVGCTDLFGANGLREALWNEMSSQYFATVVAAAGLVIVAGAWGSIRRWRHHDV